MTVKGWGRAATGALAALAMTGAAHAAQAPRVQASASPPASPAPMRPKLVVAIAVDQFSGNLFDDWRGRFTGGLRRLADGVAYPAGYQSHAATETCPGHSTILTGKHPNKTGIVGNDIRDEATGAPVYCLADPSKVLAHGGSDTKVSPNKLLATTLGDWLKAASPQSRVVAVSGKDRGAINMAGHNGDAVFWLKTGFGFTTYMDPGTDPAQALAPVAELNARLAPMWKTRPVWTMAAACRPYAADWPVGNGTFHSTVPPTGWGQSDEPAKIATDVGNSPLPDALTLEAAEHLIRRYKLGQGPATDLLAVSFSATDYVGHRYGTRGPEMCDNLMRLDALVGRLFADLDALKVPYVVVLTADHGGSDLPERLQAQGYPAVRAPGDLLAKVKAAASKETGVPESVFHDSSLQEIAIDVKDPVLRRRVAQAVKTALKAQSDYVADAFTLDELLATPIPHGKAVDELTLQERFAESVYPGRSPDVLAALKPYATTYAANVGSTLAGHGSVWDYDRRVPILFWWPGAPSQTRFLPVETVDIAPTLAPLLGLTPPADVDGRCLPLAERGPGACK